MLQSLASKVSLVGNPERYKSMYPDLMTEIKLDGYLLRWQLTQQTKTENKTTLNDNFIMGLCVVVFFKPIIRKHN